MERNKQQGLGRLVRACAYSWKGIRSAWIEERAFREEIGLAVVILPAGLYVGRSGLERAALTAPMLLVLIVELLNSAIEALVDRGGLGRDNLAAMAKDMGSAAVLLSLGLLALVWVLVISDR
ncbi:MAG: diacylglycerol kinase [Steroidobacteraceae bacterium]